MGMTPEKYSVVETVLWRRAGIVKASGTILLSQFIVVLVAAATRVQANEHFSAIWAAITIPEKVNILTTALICIWATLWNDKSIVPPGKNP